jgi:hypothetical protein
MNTGKLIAGIALVAEGAALAYYGYSYIDFMERNGMMDLGKKMLRATGIRSHKALAAIGIAEVMLGALLVNGARPHPQREIAAA